tara:strand:+ start:354 stop:617 length:264 start_codon:yes stop_codon:yes gene_type:complete
MTKREIQRLHREQFFTAVCEKYPGTVIDSDGFGRWQIYMENFTFDLSGISYGGQIDCYEIKGSEQYEEGIVIEKELQLLWYSLAINS